MAKLRVEPPANRAGTLRATSSGSAGTFTCNGSIFEPALSPKWKMTSLPRVAPKGSRHDRAGKIADAEVVRVVAAPLIQVVFDGEDVIARFGKGVVDLGVFAQAGKVVAVGDFAARGVEQPQRRIEGRADAAGENLQRKPLPRFDMELVELADQRLERWRRPRPAGSRAARRRESCCPAAE